MLAEEPIAHARGRELIADTGYDADGSLTPFVRTA
jgi:hypothetical protein